MQVGDVIAERFELVSIAGEGGMGLVFRAHDRATGREVALKTMLRAGAKDALRFDREVRVLRELAHPGIVAHVSDGTSDSGEPWLAMEWLEGEDLATRIGRGALSCSESVSVACGIADALGYAHGRGLVHRDLKPSNVWLRGGVASRRAVTLLDFGVVRHSDPRASRLTTRAGLLLGTPAYMSPEQARGEVDVDARTDLFGLGCVLFECLTGRAAFVGGHVVALLAKVLLEEPPRVASLVTVPRELDAVACLLAKERSARPRDAVEVLRALESVGSFDSLGFLEVNETAPTRDGREPLAREQRWLCVLLVSQLPVSGEGATLAELPPEVRTVDQVAADSGARLEHLAVGAQVLLWESLGAPAELASRAAHAALSLRTMGLRLALASGRVAVDGLTPVGQALERAAECVKDSTGEVLLDDSIADLLAERFDVKRGVAERWTLVDERAPEVTTRPLLGRSTPCVGREVELSVLGTTLGQVLDDGSASALVLTGEMGVGKSRVRQEWVRALALSHPEVRVWQAHADVMHERVAYGIASGLVRDGCGVPFGASGDQVRRCILEAVTLLVEEKARLRLASRLSELCGAPWEGDVDDALVTARQDAIVMGDQLRAAWEDFLVASCRERAVVLVVENLQWADGPSLALIDRALRNFGDLTWMVLGVGRPEHRDKHPKLWSERGMREQILGPLKDKPAERLARAVLGAAVAEERIKRLVSKATGNPYFLEELLRAEAEGHGDATPDTVLAMVEARLLRLEPGMRRVLRAASVYGGAFHAAGVATVLGEACPEDSLEALVARDWLTALEGGGYVFRQATSREAAYAMLVEEDKRLAHARAAEHLTKHGSDPVAIAEHYERAHEPEHAAPWWASAAKLALEANDFPGCIARAEAAERCGARSEDLAEALLARVEAHAWLNENPTLRETVERLATSATSLEQEAAALQWRALGALRAGDTTDLERTLQRLADLTARHPGCDSAVFSALRTAANALSAGLVARADALVARFEAAEPHLEKRSPRVLGAWARWCGQRAYHTHDYERALDLYREATLLLRGAGDVRTAVTEEANRGYLLLMLGAYEEASQLLEASLTECRRLGLSYAIAVTQHNLGLALLGLGRLEPALQVEREASAAFAAGRDSQMEAASRDYTSRILVATGRAREAVTEAERAIALLATDHPIARMAQASLADALLNCGGPDDTAAALNCVSAAREALLKDPAHFEEPAFILRVHLDALEANGLADEARQAREEARAWVRDRASKIRSEHYRRTFLEGARDVARISTSAVRER